MSTTKAPDLATLSADAEKAQKALDVAKAEQAIAEKKAADERTARSIAWAYHRVLSYPGDLAAANAAVSDALAAFDAVVLDDLAAAPAAYLRVVRTMAAANVLGADLTRARHILRTAGEIPMINRPGRDPVGDAAPWPLTHGLVRVPGFVESVTDALDKARRVISIAPSTENPETFEGHASAALKHDALAAEWVQDQQMELMLALRAQHPTHYAERIPADQQAQVSAYAACREAAGHADDPLPIAAIPLEWSDPAPAPRLPSETERWTLRR